MTSEANGSATSEGEHGMVGVVEADRESRSQDQGAEPKEQQSESIDWSQLKDVIRHWASIPSKVRQETIVELESRVTYYLQKAETAFLFQMFDFEKRMNDFRATEAVVQILLHVNKISNQLPANERIDNGGIYKTRIPHEWINKSSNQSIQEV